MALPMSMPSGRWAPCGCPFVLAENGIRVPRCEEVDGEPQEGCKKTKAREAKRAEREAEA
jgi:hypothetical protein